MKLDGTLTASALFTLKHCPPLTVQGSARNQYGNTTTPHHSTAKKTSRLVLLLVASAQSADERPLPIHAAAPPSSTICCWTAPLWQRAGITSSEHDVGGVQR